MGKNGYFSSLTHCRLKFNVCLNLHITLSTFGKHCSTHIMSWFVCLNDLLFNKWVCIISGGEEESSPKELYFWLRKAWLIRLGRSWDNHISCCHTLVETGSSHAAFWFFSWMKDATKHRNSWNYTKQPSSAGVITFILRPLVLENLTWDSCFFFSLFKVQSDLCWTLAFSGLMEHSSVWFDSIAH